MAGAEAPGLVAAAAEEDSGMVAAEAAVWEGAEVEGLERQCRRRRTIRWCSCRSRRAGPEEEGK